MVRFCSSDMCSVLTTRFQLTFALSCQEISLIEISFAKIASSMQNLLRLLWNIPEGIEQQWLAKKMGACTFHSSLARLILCNTITRSGPFQIILPSFCKVEKRNGCGDCITFLADHKETHGHPSAHPNFFRIRKRMKQGYALRNALLSLFKFEAVARI